MLYACDAVWWEHYQPAFAGLKVSQDVVGGDVLHVPSVDRPGLSLDPMVIHQGGNSAYQALNLAVLMGAARVLLLGCDMQPGPGGRRHWHGDHPPGVNNPGEHNYRRWLEAFAAVGPSLEAAGVEVVNCTPGGALECFRRLSLEEGLR